MVIDALGNEVIVGQWYGYSSLGSGWSHSTLGRVKYVTEKTGKVRLENCRVKRYLYGEPTDFKADVIPSDVSIRGTMIFPIPTQE